VSGAADREQGAQRPRPPAPADAPADPGPAGRAAAEGSPAAGAPDAESASPDAPPPGNAASGLAGADLARAALAAAKARARRLEEGRGAVRGRGGYGSAPLQRRSGSGPDDRDPQTLEAALSRLLAEAGWEAPAAVGGVIHGWADLVGARIAAHCEPVSFDEGVLTVQTDSSAWATELRNLSGMLLAKLNAALPRSASITRILVLGPHTPSWRWSRPSGGGGWKPRGGTGGGLGQRG
jgi:predicted nucleic acid-binding Zn ribbon protein